MRAVLVSLLYPMLCAAECIAAVSVNDFGAIPNDGIDDTVAFYAAIEQCREQEASSLILQKGIYDFFPVDESKQRYLNISNNDDGMKSIVCDLSGFDGLTINGQGSEMIMHGYVIPFYMNRARNITIKNLIIDWANPFYVQADVIQTGENWFECRFQNPSEAKIIDGELVAINPDIPDPVHFHNINFIDPERGEQARHSTDEYAMLKPGNCQFERLGDGVYRLTSASMRNDPKVNQIAVFQYKGRPVPAISVQSSSDIRIEHVTQYFAGAIANIFEASRGLYIDHLKMIRRPGSGRWYTALNDATHFVDCSGDIFIQNSHFEFQGDDATNIHGVYRTIAKQVDDRTLRLRLMHHQQLGFNSLYPGDRIALCSDTVEVLKIVKIISVQNIDKTVTDYTFDEILPDLDWDKTFAMRYDTDVNVDISGNIIQNNRARGLLIKTYGRVRIYDNYFHSPGPAIRCIANKPNHWYESGPVNDVEIFNNHFDHCGFGGWAGALLFISGNKEGEPLHSNVRIHNNKIEQIGEYNLFAQGVRGLEFYDNEIIPGTRYETGERMRLYQFGENVITGRMQMEVNQ